MVGPGGLPLLPELFWEVTARWRPRRTALTVAPDPTDERLAGQLGLLAPAGGWVLCDTQRVLQTTEPSIAAYGDLAWLSVMDRANQTAFLDEAVPLLLVALTGGSPDAVFELIEDWQVTARLWSDEELRRELASDAEAPLRSVEL
ncbi:MAG: hypothetical protein ACR2JF_08260 [Iamia sp.]